MHFSKEIIRQVVKEVELGVSRRDLCQKYGMGYSTLGDWMSKYGSQDYRDSLRSQFSDSQRRTIVRSLQDGKMTLREVSLTYNVSKKTLSRWLKDARSESIPAIAPPLEVGSSDPRTDALEKALAEAKLKIRALETLIDVAEEDLKIKIRKKPGAKQ